MRIRIDPGSQCRGSEQIILISLPRSTACPTPVGRNRQHNARVFQLRCSLRSHRHPIEQTFQRLPNDRVAPVIIYPPSDVS